MARFVEEASGLTISKYMEERLFRPAGMGSTGFVIDESLAKNCVSTDYHPWVLSSVADGVPKKWSRFRYTIKTEQRSDSQVAPHWAPEPAVGCPISVVAYIYIYAYICIYHI